MVAPGWAKRSPASGCTSPAAMRSKVDFPEPLRPTRQILSPAATVRAAPDSSGTTPKVRLMSCSASNGSCMSQPVALCLAPNGREPGLPVSRQARRAIVMVQLNETGRSHVIAPGVEVEEAGIAIVAEALFVVSSRVRREQNTARLHRSEQFQQNPRQFLARDMEQRGVGKNPIKAALRQSHSKQILVQDLAS